MPYFSLISDIRLTASANGPPLSYISGLDGASVSRTMTHNPGFNGPIYVIDVTFGRAASLISLLQQPAGKEFNAIILGGREPLINCPPKVLQLIYCVVGPCYMNAVAAV